MNESGWSDQTGRVKGRLDKQIQKKDTERETLIFLTEYT